MILERIQMSIANRQIFIIIGIIVLNILEVFILQIMIHWLFKFPMDGAEEIITLIIVFLVITPFTFIVWKHIRNSQEAEKRFRNLAENSLVGIYSYYNGKFRYVNQRFLDKTG